MLRKVTGNEDIVPEFTSSEDDEEWDWNNEENWPWLCKNGLGQSPINIESSIGDGPSCTDYELKWKLGKALTPKAVFENNEVKILGNFGSVVFSHK